MPEIPPREFVLDYNAKVRAGEAWGDAETAWWLMMREPWQTDYWMDRYYFRPFLEKTAELKRGRPIL
jgi:hypothetical protein